MQGTVYADISPVDRKTTFVWLYKVLCFMEMAVRVRNQRQACEKSDEYWHIEMLHT